MTKVTEGHIQYQPLGHNHTRVLPIDGAEYFARPVNGRDAKESEHLESLMAEFSRSHAGTEPPPQHNCSPAPAPVLAQRSEYTEQTAQVLDLYVRGSIFPHTYLEPET